ncbi:glycerol-3-phosphate dehydrogenase/oxidase [Bacillus alkalicellulosilyticus]|uniref:glycerol-3-phosphate dehydrogenase/oxidase n=1 Tax=Alkalihalobacterium alkalicellulosilyticum TaxID=1912214 RepID=UPI00099844C1|nr:glycerol-3-phosphate dehydrogenase/oxidase [Bacillus alkalicellulosilyticus]
MDNEKRIRTIMKLKDVKVDVLVIGGGITGSGIALDAQVRGLSTGLIEMQDFAAGTSSRSTKLIHGGLRYLKQLEFKLVSEVGKERAIVYENAPHVTTPIWMMLPIYKGGTFGKWSTSLGLSLYDILAKVKKTERRIMLSPTQAKSKEPLLKTKGLKGAGNYVEYRTDDARLTIEIIKTAVDKGALAVNYVKANTLLYEQGKVSGVEAVDGLTGDTFHIKAKKVVNATGPWVDFIREKDQSKEGKHLFLTKGVHIVFDKSKFPLQQAVYFDTPFKDGRMIFAIPRGDKTYVGTTDTVFHEDPVHPQMTEEDLTYLLEATNAMFPSLTLKAEDIESSWSGLRPLIHEEGKKPSDISRKDELFLSHSGLITIAGGKLTGYRKMAEKVVDVIVKQLKKETGVTYPPCSTAKVTLSGGEVGGTAQFPAFIEKQIDIGIKIGLSATVARNLVDCYGSNISYIYDNIIHKKELNRQSKLPLHLFGSLLYGLEHEMVITPSDFFIRRTGALYFKPEFVWKWKERVLQFITEYLQLSEEKRISFSKQIETELYDSIKPIKDVNK